MFSGSRREMLRHWEKWNIKLNNLMLMFINCSFMGGGVYEEEEEDSWRKKFEKRENNLRHNFRKEDVGFAFCCCSSPSNARRRGKLFPLWRLFYVGLNGRTTNILSSHNRECFTVCLHKRVWRREGNCAGRRLSIVFRMSLKALLMRSNRRRAFSY